MSAAQVPSFWEDDWPAPRHALSCPIWTSADPADICKCDGVDDPSWLRSEPGSVAAALDALCRDEGTT